MTAIQQFNIRDFLRAQEALLVHFNTPMSRHETGFPDDLRGAKTLAGVPLSFSTIQAGDSGPSHVRVPAEANAQGSVGIVVDIAATGSVITVEEKDSGSGPHGSGGLPPTLAACSHSISARASTNEWWVKDFKTLGIFCFLPPYVYDRAAMGERQSSLEEVLAAFPNERVFSTYPSASSFMEFDRTTGEWVPVAYQDVVP